MRDTILLSCAAALAPALAAAQPAELAPAAPAPAPAPEPVPAPGDPSPERSGPKLTVNGYLEAFYQAHVQDPSNRVTSLRGFDSRSRTFTLSNAALDVKGEQGPIAVRIALQVGHAPAAYYAAEPVSAGAGGANASGPELWRYLQISTVTAKLPGAWAAEAGLFPSPIGIEVIPIKDNMSWSRSNLFFGLPFYHAGAALSRALGGGWTGKLAVYNGWNSVVDNNAYPSVAASAAYASEGGTTTAQLLYFGGIERASGAAEGRPWRHLLDAYVQHAVTSRLTLAAHADAGIEPNELGTSAWAAAALYGKLALGEQLYAAVRADYFYERVTEDDDGARTAAIFWPVAWVASATATLAYQPVAGISVRLEYRHDRAADDAFFGGAVATDPITGALIANRDTQDTVTLGATAWF